jgi:xylan 1,4-beta-xylosidase
MAGPRTHAGVLAAMAVMALSGCLGGDDDGGERTSTAPAPAPPAAVHASADLGAAPEPAASMSGLLHGVAGATPPDSAVLPLRPRVWRSVPSRVPYARAAAVGARYQLVLSDLWGYPPTAWEGRGPPWRDLDAWERLVRRAARSLRGREVEWDVWNEPDNEVFWTGTREQFFAVYETAARALVDELGEGAVVGGPSTTKARPEWLEGLLGHCRRRGCRVGFLSFHANLDADEPIPPLEDRVRSVRALIPRYRDLSLSRVEINESIGPTDQYRPGEILGFLHHMEAGGADAAVRSCWPALDGSDQCSDGTLDGLLTPDGQPRSAWWAYRLYAEGVGARVPASSDSEAVAVLASRRTVAGAAQVLLARNDRAAEGSPRLSVELTLRGLRSALGGARSAIVSIQQLSDTGEQPLAAPPVVAKRRIALDDGDLTLRVGSLGLHQALAVKVFAAGRAQSPAA